MNQQIVQPSRVGKISFFSQEGQFWGLKLLRQMKFLLLVLCLTLAGWSNANENYLRNGGFEQELTNWGIWGLHPAAVRLATEETVSGENSVLFSGMPGAKMIGLEQKQLPLKPDKTYSLSLHLKIEKKLSDKVRILVGILERDKRGKVQKQHYQVLPLPKNNKWTKCIMDITTSDMPCEYYQIVFRLDNLQDGEKIWVDNLELTELNPKPA